MPLDGHDGHVEPLSDLRVFQQRAEALLLDEQDAAATVLRTGRRHHETGSESRRSFRRRKLAEILSYRGCSSR